MRKRELMGLFKFLELHGYETDSLSKFIFNLKHENEELKKELKDTNLILIDYQDLEIRNKEYKNQQQEFINYLEDDLKEKYRDMGYRHNIYREILQKYKSIIGIDINVGSKGVKDEKES